MRTKCSFGNFTLPIRLRCHVPIEICHVQKGSPPPKAGNERHARERHDPPAHLAARTETASSLWPLMATLLVVGWSSGFVGIRYASEEASVMLVCSGARFLSGVILLPFALIIGPRLRMRGVVEQMLFGVMSVFLYLGGFALAIEQRVPTGLVALISDLLPLAIAACRTRFGRTPEAPRNGSERQSAVLGVLIVSFDSLSFGTAPLWAYGLTGRLHACFCARLGSAQATAHPAHCPCTRAFASIPSPVPVLFGCAL